MLKNYRGFGFCNVNIEKKEKKPFLVCLNCPKLCKYRIHALRLLRNTKRCFFSFLLIISNGWVIVECFSEPFKVSIQVSQQS